MKRVLLSLGVALLFASAPAADAGAGEEPVRIGVSLGLTGKYQAPAIMQQRAYELWRDEVNGRGGLDGREVEVVIRDDHSDPAEANRIYQEFVEDGAMDLVFGPYSSELTEAVAPIVDEAGYPMLAAGAAADEIWRQGHENVFGMWTPATRYSQGMLRLAHEAGIRAVAILHADDPFSEEIAAGARKWAPFLKLDVVTDIRFAKGTVDLVGQAMQAREAGSELVIIAGHRDEAVNARRALAKLRWLPRAFFATVGPALPEWRDVMGEHADGAFTTSIWEPHESVTYPRSGDFAAAFRQRYKVDASYHAATAYAAGQILEAALAHSGNLEQESVRATLFDLDTYSVIGRFAVDHTGMQVKRLEMILQWQGGRKEIVWPEDVRSAQPIFDRASK